MAKVNNFPELSNDSRSFQASAYESGMKKNSDLSMQVFNNPDFGEVRMTLIDGEPWFVGKDVAVILEYKYPKDAIRDNVDEEDKMTVQLSDIQDGEQDSLPDHMKGSKITIINESGLYSLILRSEKPEAKKFKKWITSEVIPSIRKTGSFSMKSLKPAAPSTSADYVYGFNAYIAGLKANLNISDASTAGLYNRLAVAMGYPEVDYVPSRGVKFSASTLLEKFGRKGQIHEFNRRMEAKGFLEVKERYSTSKPDHIKKFKALTEAGLQFGENSVSPKNEKEVQPHYYEGKFGELLNILFNA